MDSSILQDPVVYSPLPSAPPADAIVTVRPEPLTIRLVSVHTAAPIVLSTVNRQWLCYCCFIIFVFLFGIFAFYNVMFGGRKN